MSRRVAAVFANNGAGVRGDLKAVWRAVLLDPEARAPADAARPASGKLREPMLRFVAWARQRRRSVRRATPGRSATARASDTGSARARCAAPSRVQFLPARLRAAEHRDRRGAQAGARIPDRQRDQRRRLHQLHAAGARAAGIGDVKPTYAALLAARARPAGAGRRGSTSMLAANQLSRGDLPHDRDRARHIDVTAGSPNGAKLDLSPRLPAGAERARISGAEMSARRRPARSPAAPSCSAPPQLGVARRGGAAGAEPRRDRRGRGRGDRARTTTRPWSASSCSAATTTPTRSSPTTSPITAATQHPRRDLATAREDLAADRCSRRAARRR